MTAPLTPLLAALARWPDGPGSSPAARRAVSTWADDPVLSRFETPGAAAVGAAQPDGGDVLAALAGRRQDGWAATAAATALVGWLAPITTGWRIHGMPTTDLDAAEADLVCEAVADLAARAGLGATTIDGRHVAQRAWHRVHGARRTERARGNRRVALSAAAHAPARPARTAAETVLVELSRAVTTEVVTPLAAAAVGWVAAGWTTPDAARAAGMSPAALRARRSRAVRQLAGAAGDREVA